MRDGGNEEMAEVEEYLKLMHRYSVARISLGSLRIELSPSAFLEDKVSNALQEVPSDTGAELSDEEILTWSSGGGKV